MGAPLVLGLVALIGGGFAWWETRRLLASGSHEGGLLPAYPRIVSATPAQRQAILDAARAIPVSPAALATVIQSESGWDPTAPHEATGTPRAGLNQVTQGAHMPGLSSEQAVWEVRSWPMVRQLKEIVVPYFLRIKAGRKNWKGDTALDLYKVNFLPILAGEAHDVHLGEEDSDETIPGGLTKGQIYAANKGFDRRKKVEGQPGYFTWDDVAARIAQVELAAHGQVVDVAGKVSLASPKGN